MCTVIIEVPEAASRPTRVLAVRDEHPGRPWDPPGEWWPGDHPGVLGVRDRRANGAWLAYAPRAGRLSVVVNRGDEMAEPPGGFTSRGGLVLASVAGEPPADPPTAAPFSLVEVRGPRATVSAWDGVALHRQELAPGMHMLAHGGVDDPASARIARWLPEFAALSGEPDETWRAAWLELLERTTELPPTDDRAIVRDNRPLGYPTLSLLTCVAEVGGDSVALSWAACDEPGRWGEPRFAPADRAGARSGQGGGRRDG